MSGETGVKSFGTGTLQRISGALASEECYLYAHHNFKMSKPDRKEGWIDCTVGAENKLCAGHGDKGCMSICPRGIDIRTLIAIISTYSGE